MLEPFICRVIHIGIDKFLVLGPVDNCERSIVPHFILKHQVFKKLSLVSFFLIFHMFHSYLKVKLLFFCQSFFFLKISLILIEFCTFGTRQIWYLALLWIECFFVVSVGRWNCLICLSIYVILIGGLALSFILADDLLELLNLMWPVFD